MELAALASPAGTAAAATAAGSAIGPVTAAASGAGALGGVAGAALYSALPSAGILSSLSTGLSLASMASDIFGGVSAGKAAADQLTQQAEQDFLSAKQEELQGKQAQNDINANLLQTVAAQRLAYSGAGVDFSFGTPASLERSMSRQAELQLSTTRDNARIKTLARRRGAYAKLSQVGDAQSAPVMAGVKSAFQEGKNLAGKYI